MSSAQREPLARAHDVADQLGLFRPRRLEQHRARIAVEDAAHVDQIDRLVAHLAFAEIDELVDEIAQPEALGIDRRHGRLPTALMTEVSRKRFSNACA